MKKYEAVIIDVVVLNCDDIMTASGDLPFDSEPDYL